MPESEKQQPQVRTVATYPQKIQLSSSHALNVDLIPPVFSLHQNNLRRFLYFS